MTIKLLVFDVDGTLAPTEEPIPRTVSEKIVHFEHLGFQIVFISGRTASYLAGLARGIGLKKPLVAGENGGVIFNPATKWEKTLAEIPRETAQIIKEALFKEFEGLWFQPNQTMLTAAPRDLSQSTICTKQCFLFQRSRKTIIKLINMKMRWRLCLKKTARVKPLLLLRISLELKKTKL